MFAIVYIVLLITGMYGMFVSKGEFPMHPIPDLNIPECGFSIKHLKLDVSFGKKCFYEGYPNESIWAEDRRSEYKTSQVSKRIADGTNAYVGSSPWSVFLDINNGTHTFYCTGILITFEWIMTAAHCFEHGWKAGLVYAGSTKREDGQYRWVSPVKIFRHEYYDDPATKEPSGNLKKIKTAHDIAVVKLLTPFPKNLTEGKYYLINTVCLPNNQTELNIYEEMATATGFGENGERGQVPEYLQIVDIKLQPSRYCKGFHGVLCADNFGTSSIAIKLPRLCLGDSGGPLVQYDEHDKNRAILAGVGQGFNLHWGGKHEGCNSAFGTTFWVPPMRFIDWILEKLSNN